jgi:hypothetical protein
MPWRVQHGADQDQSRADGQKNIDRATPKDPRAWQGDE